MSDTGRKMFQRVFFGGTLVALATLGLGAGALGYGALRVCASIDALASVMSDRNQALEAMRAGQQALVVGEQTTPADVRVEMWAFTAIFPHSADPRGFDQEARVDVREQITELVVGVTVDTKTVRDESKLNKEYWDLAAELLGVDGVREVRFTPYTVTVKRVRKYTWAELAPGIVDILTRAFPDHQKEDQPTKPPTEFSKGVV